MCHKRVWSVMTLQMVGWPERVVLFALLVFMLFEVLQLMP